MAAYASLTVIVKADVDPKRPDLSRVTCFKVKPPTHSVSAPRTLSAFVRDVYSKGQIRFMNAKNVTFYINVERHWNLTYKEMCGQTTIYQYETFPSFSKVP